MVKESIGGNNSVIGRKRILIVSPMPPAMGGISVSSARLRDRLEKDGYEVDTYNLQIKVPRRIHGVWQLLNMLWLPFYVFGKRKYDIIHFHVSGYWRRMYIWITKFMLKGSKIVVTIHGDLANFIKMPMCNRVMSIADHIICVRHGNLKLLPTILQRRASETPAFIMPSTSTIASEKLPNDVSNFIENACSENIPIIIFNGSIVLSGPFYDLYGFNDMVTLLDRMKDDEIKFAALLIVNDLYLDAERKDFLKKIKEKLALNERVRICSGKEFSLLPVFSKKNIIYIRPTKTDGDSLSVREALALGSKVVASNVAPRPQGTICYDMKKGADALYSAVKVALNETDVSQVANNDYYDKIIEVYTSLL